ncbi:MAG: glycosyl transferase [Pseudomonadota bacterium]
MTSIAFFAHDENDAAVLRRLRAFEANSFDVRGFAMRRTGRNKDGWARVDLGRTYDGRLVHRLGRIAAGAGKAAAARALLASCDVVYARNLDMLLCAHLALRKARLSKPVIYECLDIHRLMHRRDALGLFMRFMERWLLQKTALLVVSSPAFLCEYFEIYHAGAYKACLVENRMAQHELLPPRPQARADIPYGDRPLRIGWFGVLRCRRSLALLEAVARHHEGRVEIVMHGFADIALPDFHDRIKRHQNMRYCGRYRSPEDLAKIYADVDLIWAGDFHDAGFNSRWLLPNRIYEGGYFGVPAIAPADSETGRWLKARGAGFMLREPLESSLPDLVGRLIVKHEKIKAIRQRLLHLPAWVFIQPDCEMKHVIMQALPEKQLEAYERPRVLNTHQYEYGTN